MILESGNSNEYYVFSGGAINYLAEAQLVMSAILQDEINQNTWTVKLGDLSARIFVQQASETYQILDVSALASGWYYLTVDGVAGRFYKQ